MDVRVEEGRLVEVPTPGATGMDRRAFGEFVGPRGELASYAFGWSTDPDATEGRLTVGIGAGNPGGGTFHAVVFVHEDSYAFSLVDEPFEDVPEGGPDLRRDDALAHRDLPVHLGRRGHRDGARPPRLVAAPLAAADARDRDRSRSSSSRSRSCSSSTTTMTSSGS